ncbi:hypothetical protein KP79_PYT07783 [Mizuhopecten yessoensis]|uniref:C-type lectin domain-containing protein n=1 Tax=Mizuhopecten yessoensis TaxID=6573 RepID=A0A210PY10_MIZYE|nr:hypothetical protein KP79_PYT07783 [Mizuhopecten yessoensis]
MIPRLNRFNWCSNLNLTTMPTQMAHDVCGHFAGRMDRLSTEEITRITENLQIKELSNPPLWIDHNVDGECILIENPNQHYGSKCITSPACSKEYKSFWSGNTELRLKFHCEGLDWTNARSTCQSEGGRLTKVDSETKWNALTSVLLDQGKGKEEWWIGSIDGQKTCWMVKDAKVTFEFCHSPKKFVCEKLQ